MIKQSVKKPFTVLVAVIMVIALGVVSLTKMTADLLPSLSLPYLIVITTYPGASPEKVESDVTKPIEEALGTVTGVKTVSSTSAENYSTVQLEFEDDTDMDSALVKVFSALDPVEADLPSGVGTPQIMEVSMDMLATAYIGFQYDGMDIFELTSFANDEIIPAIERVDGVASITKMGMVEQTIHVQLNEEKVDDLNNRILAKTNSSFDKAYKQLNDAKKQLVDSQKEIDDAKAELPDQWQEYYDGVEELEQSKIDLEKNKQEIKDNLKDVKKAEASLLDNFDMLSAGVAGIDSAGGPSAIQSGLSQAQSGLSQAKGYVTTLTELKATAEEGVAQAQAAVDMDPTNTEYQTALATAQGQLDALNENLDKAKAGVTTAQSYVNKANEGLYGLDGIIEAYNGLREALDMSPVSYSSATITDAQWKEISTGWQGLWGAAVAKLNTAKVSLESADAQMESADAQIESAQKQLDSAKEQLDGADEQLSDGQKQINDGWETYYESVESFNKQKNEILKTANADQLLKLSTLAQLIYAQNFAMPAGYIDDENDQSWLLKVGENYSSVEDLNDVVLCNIADIGDIRLTDVADITVIDNSGNCYSKINGERSVLLAVYKSSTASTKEVGDAVIEAAEELETQFPGLHSLDFFNQGDYIDLLTSSILDSMIIGAALAIVILAWFLKDYRPTLVVAISMPLSILLAIVALYFSGITLNIMSLAGLALGVGMLVDNSIVVIENIYRLKTLGMSAAQAAVTGARQVAAPIISSTLTTICVFLPMIFTTGMVKDLLVPMAASVVYCLVASLLIALSVVPAAGSTLLKNSREKDHRLFDKLMDKYGRSLGWCLSHKVVPLLVSVALLAGSVYAIIKMGIVMIPDMYAEPLVITITLDDDKTREEAYDIVDKAVIAVSKIDGVEAASAMAAESMLSMFSSAASDGIEGYGSFLCYVKIEGDNPSEKMVKRMVADMQEALAPLDCETSISANEMDLSLLTGSGLSVYIYGNDVVKCLEISEDVMDIVAQVPGYIDISNGIEDGDKVVHLMIDKNKAMSLGLTVAQVYADLYTKISDTVTATQITIDGVSLDLEIQDATHPLTKDNLLDYEFDVSKVDGDGDTVTTTYKLGDFAHIEEEATLGTITRSDNSRYITVSAAVEEGKNATLLARELTPLIEEYEAPVGYRVEMSGESETVNDMVIEMSKLIGLGLLFIYLVMVAQFQSLLSPFIVLFTVPLAFTGGMAGLLIMGEQLSIMSLMGFTILMGTVVNNGIVFVDYVNQLRIEGRERREALIETGKTRMRPILMTALTTILAMSKLLFGSDIGSQLGGGMAVVIMGGLAYATLMTLYIVPVIYDILFKKPPVSVDVE